MGIDFTFTNVFQFISAFAPFLLVFFMVMISLFNQNIKGLVYLGGILIATLINTFWVTVVGSRIAIDSSPTCNLFNLPGSEYNNPSLSCLLVAFTAAYLILPMTYKNQFNPVIFITLLGFFSMTAFGKTSNKCTTWAGVLFGGSLGFLLGALWYMLFHMTGNDQLLYFSEVNSDNVICSRPKKQNFKCSVYKNGVLVKDL